MNVTVAAKPKETVAMTFFARILPSCFLIGTFGLACAAKFMIGALINYGAKAAFAGEG